MKKFRILSTAFLCAAFAVTAFLGARAYNANADESTFAMKTGASIRIPTEETDMTQNDNGLRFTATVSAAEYEGYAQDGTVTVGTFIMPKAYETKYGELNEDNLFGANAKYKWEDGDVTVNGDVVGAKKIIHVKANAYKADEEDDFYTINGSVLHILDENLDLEFIGRSYIRIDGEGDPTIIFAAQTSANARSVIKVAESAILNEDPAITDADVAARVEAAYNDRYVEAYKAANDGHFPTVKATVTVKKDISSDSGYVTDETLSYESTVEYKGIGEKATGKEYAIDVTDYAYAVGLDEEKVVTLDGAEFTLNYNYVANRAQIIGFDTEEEKDIHNAESANLTTYQETVVNSVDPFARDGGVTNLSIAEGIAYEGTNSLMVDMGNSWDGPAWKNGFALPFKTNTLEFYAYSPIATTRGLYLILPNFTTHGQDQLMYKEYRSTSDIVLTGGKWEKVTLTFPVEFNVVNCFEIKVSTDTRIYIDSIYAVKDYYVDENTLAPETYLDDFSFTPELKSTVYFPDELAEKSLTVSARTVNGEETGEWGALTPAAGEYTVETADEINVYELKYELDGNLLRGDFARRGMMWANFDEEDPHYVAASKEYSGAFVQGRSLITSRLNINRGRSMEFRQGYNYITHYVNNAGTLMDLGFTAKKVGMYVYCPWGYSKSGGGIKYLNAYTPKNLEFWSPNPVNAYYATRYFTPDIETDTNKVLYIEVEIGKDITQFWALGIGGPTDYCIFIDSIMLLA